MWIVTVRVNHDPEFMLGAALTGFGKARERFVAQAAPGAAPQDVYVPLAEALWWAVTVDVGFEELSGSGKRYRPNLANYQQARDGNQAGRALLGLRYARDRCGHQRALAAVEDGLSLPTTFPNALGERFRWRRSSELPPPDPKFPSVKLQPYYDNILAGKPASMTLAWAAEWFSQERQRAEL
jgi:hypothetical protein